MSAAPALQVGFGELIGEATLEVIRVKGFKIVRLDLQKADQVKTAQLTQEVINAGLQPLCIIRRPEQMFVLPPGALVELGNEPDIAKFGWTPATYLKAARECVLIAQQSGQRLYIGAVSNLNKRGFAFLEKLPWKTWSTNICCSVHRYPDGRLPTNPHKGFQSRDHEIQRLRHVVGNRPLAVTEVGYHDGPGGWTEVQVAEHMAWERKFFDRHGFDFVVAFQVNDGLPSNNSTEAHFGFRRFNSLDNWKPVARSFVEAVTPVAPPVELPPVVPTPPVAVPPVSGAIVATFKSDHGLYLVAEADKLVNANRPAVGAWEQFSVERINDTQVALKSWQGFYLSAELDKTVRARATAIGPWETWTFIEVDGRLAFRSDHGFYLVAETNGMVNANRLAVGPWELWHSEPAGWWKPQQIGTNRPLIGPLKVINKLFHDNTGPRRVLFCSWFPALRVLRDNPVEFERQIQAIADAGYQGFRTFFTVGGWSTYWDGREVAPITFQKWFHSPASGLHRPASLGAIIQAWSDYDDLLRTLLRACKARKLRLHQSVGDMQIICPDAAGKSKELDLNRRFARICAEEGGLEVMALVGDTNEYPQNRYGADSPESVEQMGRVLRIWEEAIPGILTTMGSAISEEPDRLHQSITYGDVCAAHTSRGIPTAIKRTHALVHWEGAYRSFPKPFWQGEPMGWGAAVSGDRFDNYTNADGVALYAMHALTGQASNYFNGPAIHSREPLESTWGFKELPALLAKVLPEDVATWDHGNNGRGIEYWWKGKDFATATHSSWDTSPPRPVAEWTLYDGGAPLNGVGTPPRMSGLFVGKFA